MSVSSKVETGQACLKWGGGSLLLSGACVIGRRSDNDLQINNVQVSRRHALLMNHHDEWWLSDLGSRNGILLNGSRLTSARRLRDGDEIRIANHRITFNHGNQSPPHRSTVVGKTTMMAAPATDETHPPAMVCELIITKEDGTILEGEKPAQWFFGKSLERAPGGQHYALPPAARDWLAQLASEKGVAAPPLEIPRGEKLVILSLARRKEDRFFLLLREDSPTTSVERLQMLGLTERESEVMHWICEGKTNPEIADILSIAPRTANHHIEHIFKKLGVDNRQKAIKSVMERLAAV